MLFISHDRYFLNKFASKIWSMKDAGITEFSGGFDDYLLTASEEKPNNSPIASANAKKKKPAVNENAKPWNQKPIKNEQTKTQISLESQIQEAEAILASLDSEIAIHLSNSEYAELKTLYQKKNQLEERIASLYDEWVEEN